MIVVNNKINNYLVMKITINRKEFIDAFSVGSSMAGKTKTLMVLDNAKVVIKGGSALVMSNSTQNCITKRVGLVSVDGEGEFLVNPNDLLKALKSLRENELVIEVSSTTLSITHKRGRIELPVLDATEFPIMDKVVSDSVYTLDSERLFGWLNIARDFASTDELRPVMCGMLLYAKGGRIGACATDTRILFADSYEAATVGADIECVLPSAAFGALQSVLNGTMEVQVTLNERNVSFKTDDARLTCQLQVGRFPDFNRVIPQNNAISVVLDKAEALDAVNRVSLFTEKAHQLMKIGVEGLSCRFSGADVVFGKSANDECMCEHVGEDIAIGVNAEMFLKCVNHTVGDSVRLTMSEPSRPILFKDADNDNFVMLLMPMTLND